MIEKVLRQRLEEYRPKNAMEQEQALIEMLHSYVLSSLSRAGFFREAMFHGGTCLRILHQLPRFSEDLDFLLKQPRTDFLWGPFLEQVRRDCTEEGLIFEVLDRSQLVGAVKKAFLKTDSIGTVFLLGLPHARRRVQRVKIKLEIDTNPPRGSDFETHYIAFPVTAAITAQSLRSGFSTKSHALLCRQYTKGRDWFDFLWYVNRKIVPDLELLANALIQVGPWAGQRLVINKEWLTKALRQRIEEIDWNQAKDDVSRFLPEGELENIRFWSSGFFAYHVDRLEQYL